METKPGWLRVLSQYKAVVALLFGGLLLPLLLFAKIADEVHENEPFRFDDPILWGVHRHASPFFDRLMIAVSALGSPLMMTLFCGSIVVFLLIQKRRGDAAFFVTSVVGAGLLNLAAKLFFGRARPDLWLSISPRSDYSFPSGHAMGTMALVAAVCVLAWPTRYRVLTLLLGAPFVLLVGFSRLYLGVHFPSDVLGGWMASLAWVFGLHLLRDGRSVYLQFRQRRER